MEKKVFLKWRELIKYRKEGVPKVEGVHQI